MLGSDEPKLNRYWGIFSANQRTADKGGKCLVAVNWSHISKNEDLNFAFITRTTKNQI
jgi:hypothetical protein